MKIMDILDDKYTEKGTWIKDGVLMCSKKCCGVPVKECSCDSSCKHCNCSELNEEGVVERYGMRGASVAQGRKDINTGTNMNKRANNKAQDQNRELNIRNASATRRQNRNAKQVQTGIPIRAVQGQA
jgi:hypothetical protein